MNYIYKELTNNQKTAIKNVFIKRKIAITEWQLENILLRIDQALAEFDLDLHCGKYIIGKTRLLAEIKHLRRTLKKINPNTREALSLCCDVTPTMNQLDRKQMLSPLISSLVDNNGSDENMLASIADIAFDVLIEACDEATARGGQYYTGGSAVDHYAIKAGRPIKHAELNLFRKMATLYYNATNKKPSATPDGPFDDFMAAVFSVIDPQHKRPNFKKLIRAASPASSKHAP